MASTDRGLASLSDWLVRIRIGLLAIGWSAFVVKLEITSSLDGEAMFDASLRV